MCWPVCAAEATTVPLRRWANDPHRAGDAHLGAPTVLVALGREAYRPEVESLERHAALRLEHAENARLELRQHLDAIEGSKMWSHGPPGTASARVCAS